MWRGWFWSRAQVVAVIICVTTVSVGLIVVAIKWAPQWLASTHGLSPKDRADELGRVRTALLASLAGAIAVVGAYYTSRTFALNRLGQITERFTRAVDQLGNKQVDVRLGGIYGLERLARESRDDYYPIVEILTAYVREHAPWPPRADGTHEDSYEPPLAGPPNTRQGGDSRPSTDVQAVLTVLMRRTIPGDRDALINLDGTALSGSNLVWARLWCSHISQANLERAFLMDANLEDAFRLGTNLQAASLQRVRLKGGQMTSAILQRANLQGAHLEGADLRWANLEGADLSHANLKGANLSHANLKGTLYNRRTVWPTGIDPAAYGAVLAE